ncbi:plasmolipin [Onthophagus taurus]|uniref:plasmolipin n=1 Tax=Onthophagus taurus TaxID=166361 RepID=UPI000C2091B4|nr:MARVEL domain-containing protein 1 [Onthophagus taurus]
MSSAGFPSQHTTATTVSSNTTVQTNIRFDQSYLRTLPGILKCIQITVNLIGFICIECTGVNAYHSRGGWFVTVAMLGFWTTGILLTFYLFHIIEKFYKIPWLKIEFVFCCVMGLFYLIAASLAVSFPIEGYRVGGVFGFIAMCLYGGDAFLKFQSIQRGEIAQGERVTVRQTTTSPAY